jgi:hypothetical protein
MTGSPGPADEPRGLGFYLPRSVFPADRRQLVAQARRSGAPDAIIRLLQDLAGPSVVYTDVDDVRRQLRGNARRHEDESPS